MAPPLTLEDVNASGVTASIAQSGTSGVATVQASNSLQLLYNPDFYSSPDGWLCSPGSSLSCSWIPSDTGASGGVGGIGGSPGFLSTDSAFIAQQVVIPSGVTITSAVVEARLRLASGATALSNWIIGLYDPSTGNFYTASGQPSQSYTVYTVDFSQVVSPGSSYYVAVGLIALGLPGVYYELRVDWVTFNITTTEYTYSGPVLGVNTSSTVYGWLELAGLDVLQLDAEVRLANLTTQSDPIVISSGEPLTESTSMIELAPPPQGYNSGYIHVSMSKASPGIHTVYLRLVYCTEPGGGACVYYPVTLELDPPPMTPYTTASLERMVLVPGLNATIRLQVDMLTPLMVVANGEQD